MSNPVYDSARPFAQERNHNVNFNYIWDSPNSQWVPQTQSTISLDYIINNAKSYINKFGNNPNVSQSVSLTVPETIWDGSYAYLFPSDSGESMQVKSTNANDNQNIIVQGLDENFLEQTWSGNLNGQTPVNLSGTWTRVFRAYNNDSTNILGTVSVFKSGNDALSYAQILDGNNQTLMAIYTIPADCTGYLTKYQVTAHNPQSASEIGYTLQMKTREFGKALRVKSISSAGTSFEVTKEFMFPNMLPPKSDILFDIVSANGNNGSVDVEFNVALI